MNFAVAATTLAVVLPAELPDKSALASLMLGSRYRPVYVFAGVAAAFAVHVVLALVAGGLLALLPHRVLSVIIGVLFGVGAVLLVIRRGEDEAVDKATAKYAANLLAGRDDQFRRGLPWRVRRPDAGRDRKPGRSLSRPAGGRHRSRRPVVGG